MVLFPRMPAPDDWSGAKCESIHITEENDPFFIEEQYQDGIDFCNGYADGVECPIRDKCLLFALTNNCKEGVFGGTTPITRRSIRKIWPLRKGKKPRPEWHWMTEEEALSMLSEEDRRRFLNLPDEEEDDE